MTYIPSHEELRDHPKTKRAARTLGICKAQLVGHLHFLWYWGLHYAQDGDVSKYENADIAEAADWEGDPDVFVEALIHCGVADSPGFIEQTEDGKLLLHDWDNYGGKVLQAREKHAETMRIARESKRDSHVKDSDSHVIVTGQARASLDKSRVDKSRVDKNNNDSRTANADAAMPTEQLTRQDAKKRIRDEPEAVKQFEYDYLWELISEAYGPLTWGSAGFARETAAVKEIVRAVPEVTPGQIQDFLVYQTECERQWKSDKNTVALLSQHKSDFGAWWNGGRPLLPKEKRNNGNGIRQSNRDESASQYLNGAWTEFAEGTGTSNQGGNSLRLPSG